jgi:hypothetical protein
MIVQANTLAITIMARDIITGEPVEERSTRKPALRTLRAVFLFSRQNE